MSEKDVTFWIELRSEYVDTAGVKRHAGVEVVADYLQLTGEQVVATHHSSPVFTAERSDVVGIRVIDATPAAPPRFSDRAGQPWTPEEDDAIRELRANGLSTGQIAYDLARSEVEVRKRIHQLDLPPARP
jgi:hypothetical protein